jgi:Ni/Co efflux regulator RcnB
MALQIGAVLQKPFRDAAGRFISKAKHELLQRKDLATGRFISKEKATANANARKAENFLRQELGAPPAGQLWVRIADKYPDRFAGLIRDMGGSIG